MRKQLLTSESEKIWIKAMSNTHRNGPDSCIKKRPEPVRHKPKTVTRSDIAAAIVRRTPSLSPREANRILSCVLQEIADALMRGEESVKLHEFGTFYVCEKKARNRRKSLRFRASVRLKEKVEKNAAWRRCPRR
jgi:nucleoid DNA-binding protein